jgi:O-antigen/teichoic acid export membrane protein
MRKRLGADRTPVTPEDPLPPLAGEDGGTGGTAALGRGVSWTLVGQVSPMIVTVFLTPYILHGLGVARYGLFVFTSSLVAFLGTFDGGVKGTAQRYFSIYAGQKDVARATRLLSSLFLVVAVFGAVIATIGWFLAVPVASVINIPAHLRGEFEFLLRTLGILIAFSFFHSLFAGTLQAHGRFGLLTKAGLACNLLWAVGLILTVHFQWGLRGVAYVFVLQQVLLVLTVVPSSLRYVRRSEVGLISRPEIREFVAFSSRVQVSALSNLINQEFDTLVIGATLPIRSVSFYNAGANFAENISSIPFVALGPVQTALAGTFGQHGLDAAMVRFQRIQTVWIKALSGWIATAVAASYFAVVAWLGRDFDVAGVIAIVALMTWATTLSSAVIRVLCTVVGKPGPESRYGVLSVTINVVLTIPFVLLGPIGVASATLLGQLVGTAYFLRTVRRRVSPAVQNPLMAVPFVGVVVSVVTVVLLELAMRPIVPHGGFGLIVCALPALPGLVVFTFVTVGPRASLRLVRAGAAAYRRAGLRGAVRESLVEAGV